MPNTLNNAVEPAGTAPKNIATVLHPGVGFLLSHPAHFIALGAGSGLARFAPGTWGTLWAWAAFHVLTGYLNTAQMGLCIAGGFVIGIWACARTAADMNVQDPSHIVWDEVIAFWLILWLLTPAGLWAQFAAFLLFRFFDAVKPAPVAWADELFHGARGWRAGFGIMLDDLVAAACSLVLIAIWRF